MLIRKAASGNGILVDEAESRLLKHEKATNSWVKPREVEYETDFRDKQRLHIIHDKLIISSTVLESKLQIALEVHGQYNRLGSSKHLVGQEPLSAMQQIIGRIRGFRRTARALRKQNEGISDLVSPLVYRWYEKIYLLTTPSCPSSKSLGTQNF